VTIKLWMTKEKELVGKPRRGGGKDIPPNVEKKTRQSCEKKKKQEDARSPV